MRREYGPDVLAAGATRPRRAEFPSIPAERGLVVEEAVSGYADLEPALLGRVEELIDFVTAPGSY